MRSTKKNQQSGGQAEIIAAVKALASEKDISEEMLYNAIEEALKAAYKKNVSREENAPTNLSVTLDRTTGVAQVFARKTITDEVEDPANQISLEDALKIRSDYRMGDIAEIDVTPTGFLRTAAQTAKQVIMQRIREAEQGKIYDEYSEKENEILTAIVQRVEPKGVYVELGRTEGILPDSEWMPGEEYHIDDHIKVYVLEVNRTGREMLRGPQVRVSRIHPGLVKRLFEEEVAEVKDGIVEIRARNVPPGWGEPAFDKLDACLAYALMGVGAVKGVEVGDGFAAARSTGSANNDPLTPEGFASNHAGGILGGISSGQDILLRVAVKPIASIPQEQRTIDREGRPATVLVGGRHDLSAIPRIVPVLRAMTALTLADALLLQARMAALPENVLPLPRPAALRDGRW